MPHDGENSSIVDRVLGKCLCTQQLIFILSSSQSIAAAAAAAVKCDVQIESNCEI
jgi:hypothetical protein